MTRTYVRTESGRILVQLPDDSQWGFALADEDGQSWPGGFGIATSWETVAPDHVSKEDRERLGWLLDQ
jgi:hypothetical protein